MMMTLSAQDCYGSPPRATEEQLSAKKSSARRTVTITTPMEDQQQQSRKYRSFTTPAAAMTRNSDAGTGSNTSARATRGRPSTRSRNDPSSTCSGEPNSSASKSRAKAQEPRKLDLSPEQLQKRQEDPSFSSNDSNSNQIYLINLPPSLLPHWCALLICSALSLAAVASGTPLTTSSSSAATQEETEGMVDGHYENLQMVMAIATLSLMLTFLAGACYIWIPASFVGTLYEVTAVSETIPSTTGSIRLVQHNRSSINPCSTTPSAFLLDWLEYHSLVWGASHHHEP
jgi:hypothetical protein